MRQGQESAAQTGSGAAHGTEDEISNTEEAVCTSSERVLEVHGVWVLLCRWNRVFIYLHVYMCIYTITYLVGCAGSWLWHARSLVVTWEPLVVVARSNSPTRDGAQVPCTGSVDHS